jgi:fermentation-respiration switch protein FrsA (DUF1100 family)
MAARGFVALTFDPSFQGESRGEPRHLEDPAARVEDIHCAVDYLMTLPFIDEARVGFLAICAGGGYGITAALTERRFKAIGTVVASNMGAAFRKMQPDGDVLGTLETVGKQRTAEARGAGLRLDPWIPDSLAEAKEQSVTDSDLCKQSTSIGSRPIVIRTRQTGFSSGATPTSAALTPSTWSPNS